MYSVDSCVPTVNAFNFTKLTNKIAKKKKIPNSPKFEMHYIDCIKWSRCFRFQTFSCPLHLFDNKFSFLSNKRENKATNWHYYYTWYLFDSIPLHFAKTAILSVFQQRNFVSFPYDSFYFSTITFWYRDFPSHTPWHGFAHQLNDMHWHFFWNMLCIHSFLLLYGHKLSKWWFLLLKSVFFFIISLSMK